MSLRFLTFWSSLDILGLGGDVYVWKKLWSLIWKVPNDSDQTILSSVRTIIRSSYRIDVSNNLQVELIL